MAPRRGPHQLPTEGRDHERRVDSIARFGLDRVDGGAVRDLGDLRTEVVGEGLDDGPRDSKGPEVGAKADSEQAAHHADDDREVWDEAVGDEARVDGAQAHGGDADEAEEPDDCGVVVVRGRSEKKS